MLYKRDFYTLIFEKVPTVAGGIPPSPHPPPAWSLRSLAEDLRQMCPLRDFAPLKLKVFRLAGYCQLDTAVCCRYVTLNERTLVGAAYLRANSRYRK